MLPTRSLLVVLALAGLAGCLSFEPPLPVRTFAFVAPPGPADPVADGIAFGHVAPGIEDRMAWFDPRTGELGFHEAWRYLKPAPDQVSDGLAAALPAGGDRPTLHLFALWVERGPAPAARLAFRLDFADRDPIAFDAVEPVAGEGPEAIVRALGSLVARARGVVAEG